MIIGAKDDNLGHFRKLFCMSKISKIRLVLLVTEKWTCFPWFWVQVVAFCHFIWIWKRGLLCHDNFWSALYLFFNTLRNFVSLKSSLWLKHFCIFNGDFPSVVKWLSFIKEKFSFIKECFLFIKVWTLLYHDSCSQWKFVLLKRNFVSL